MANIILNISEKVIRHRIAIHLYPQFQKHPCYVIYCILTLHVVLYSHPSVT